MYAIYVSGPNSKCNGKELPTQYIHTLVSIYIINDTYTANPQREAKKEDEKRLNWCTQISDLRWFVQQTTLSFFWQY
jgi:hypothetical protein